MRTLVVLITGLILGAVIGLVVEEAIARPIAEQGGIATGTAVLLALIWPISIITCTGLALAIDTHLRRRTRNRPDHAERHEDNDGDNRSPR
ncbi:MAG: hypothetical protein Q8Q02_15905 [Nocardioides sp.]|nr:hypothetical protein [Nocardioides sp.]